jgi:hypothetical protein
MPQKQSIPLEWLDRLTAFKEFASAEELARSHPPPHKMTAVGMEIWHYPFGILGGTLYAIHVAVSGGAAPMAYMYMEPCNEPDTVKPRRPWWRFW